MSKTLDIKKGLQNSESPSATNPFATMADLNAAIGLNNQFHEILANGNTTGGTDIAVSTGDKITGVAELILDAVSYVAISAATTVDLTATAGAMTLTTVAGDVIVSSSAAIDLTAGVGDVALTAVSGDVALTASGAVDINATAGDITLLAVAGALLLTGDSSVTIAANNLAVGITAGTTLGLIGGTGMTLTATTGDLALVTSGADNITLTTSTGDAVFNIGDAFGLTAVSATLSTRQTIWTTQAAGAVALSNSFSLHSDDIAPGNAAPHFTTENGNIVKLFRGAAVADAAGGATVDAEGRAAINALLDIFRVTGGNGLIAD